MVISYDKLLCIRTDGFGMKLFMELDHDMESTLSHLPTFTSFACSIECRLNDVGLQKRQCCMPCPGVQALVSCRSHFLRNSLHMTLAFDGCRT